MKTKNYAGILSQETLKKIFGKAHDPASKRDSEMQVTIPEPFSFDSKERIDKSAHAKERKFEEIKEEQERLIRYYSNYQIKANPIPESTALPLYEEIMRRNEARRQMVKSFSVAITKANEKPFSFYHRKSDAQERHKKHCGHGGGIPPEFFNENRFRALPIPWYCQPENLQYFHQQLAREEEEKKELKEAHKEWLKSASELPPNMKRLKEKEEHFEKEKTAKIEALRNQYTVKPVQFKATPIPDYKKLQREFEEKLIAKKSEFTPTVPKPIQMRPPKVRVQKELKNGLKSVQESRKSVNAAKKQGKSKLKKSQNQKVVAQIPSATRAHLLRMEQRKQEQEKKLIEEQIKLEEEEQREFRRQHFAKKVNQSPALNDHKVHLEQAREQRKAEHRYIEREREIEYQNFLLNMYQRVYSQPLMLEDPNGYHRMVNSQMEEIPQEEAEEKMEEHGEQMEENEEGQEEHEDDEEQKENEEERGVRGEKGEQIQEEDVEEREYDEEFDGEDGYEQQGMGEGDEMEDDEEDENYVDRRHSN